MTLQSRSWPRLVRLAALVLVGTAGYAGYRWFSLPAQHGELGLSVLNDALRAAREIESARPRTRALCEIAGAQVEAREVTEATRTFQQTLQAAREIHSAWARAEALREIAAAQAKAGQHEQAFQSAWDIEDADERARAAAAIASVLLASSEGKLE